VEEGEGDEKVDDPIPDDFSSELSIFGIFKDGIEVSDIFLLINCGVYTTVTFEMLQNGQGQLVFSRAAVFFTNK
jgi:hypothetical protein